jgi:hypothetical protein
MFNILVPTIFRRHGLRVPTGPLKLISGKLFGAAATLFKKPSVKKSGVFTRK